jgi:histidinol-phosphate aminotransferase
LTKACPEDAPAGLIRPTGTGFKPYVWAPTSAEIAKRHRLSPAHVLRFDSNLPPVPAALPLPASAALADRGQYPDGAYAELRAAAAAYAGCRPEETAVEAGADGLIGLIARTFLDHGRRAVVEEVTYPLYGIASRLERADLEAGPRDLEALAKTARSTHSQLLWLCNPGNPSGELWRAEDIAAAAEELPRTLVCVDEAYFEYGGETVAPSARELPNLVAIRTLSKAFGLAGLRVGYAVASKPLTAALEARRAPAPISTVAARLGAAALRAPSVAAAVEATVAERERLRAALAAAGYDVAEVHANFVYIRITEATTRAGELERKGLVVRAFADGIRATVRLPSDNDLLLAALEVEPTPSSRPAATIVRPRIRASVALEGSGRARVSTGDADRDERLERTARDRRVDFELVAERGTDEDEVETALEDALCAAATQRGDGGVPRCAARDRSRQSRN